MALSPPPHHVVFFDSRRVMFFVYCTCVYNARLAYFGASEISQSPLRPLFALDVPRVGGGGGERGGKNALRDETKKRL